MLALHPRILDAMIVRNEKFALLQSVNNIEAVDLIHASGWLKLLA
jgi:hypothetical protein